jgi:hypothetical protein
MKLIKIRKILFLMVTVIVIFSTGCEDVQLGVNEIEADVDKKTTEGTVKIYGSDGTLLGETTIKNGRYDINMANYTGKIRVVANIKNRSLKAYSEVNSTKLLVDISSLSNVAAKLIEDINSTDIIGINEYVSKLFGRITEEGDTDTSILLNKLYDYIIKNKDENITKFLTKKDIKEIKSKSKLPVVENFIKSINGDIASGTSIGNIKFYDKGSPITSFTLSDSRNF